MIEVALISFFIGALCMWLMMHQGKNKKSTIDCVKPIATFPVVGQVWVDKEWNGHQKIKVMRINESRTHILYTHVVIDGKAHEAFGEQTEYSMRIEYLLTAYKLEDE